MKYLTYNEAAELLGMAKPTLYSKVSRKEIPHIRLSGRHVIFDPDEIRAWLDQRRVGAVQAQGGLVSAAHANSRTATGAGDETDAS